MAITDVRALAFDVFGTVVDYRSTIIAEGEQLSQKKGYRTNWGAFAEAWRGRYRPSMERVMSGEIPWHNLDALHRLALDDLLEKFSITDLTEEEKIDLNNVWHRLQPWPEAIEGLTRLRQRFILSTLSNGNMALLVDMAKYSELPWDCILSAELVHAYKPDPRAYRMVFELLGLRPEQVMMVAAHQSDLHAASASGMRTAFVRRALEFGPEGKPELEFDPSFDLNATNFLDLANQLGI